MNESIAYMAVDRAMTKNTHGGVAPISDTIQKCQLTAPSAAKTAAMPMVHAIRLRSGMSAYLAPSIVSSSPDMVMTQQAPLPMWSIPSTPS